MHRQPRPIAGPVRWASMSILMASGCPAGSEVVVPTDNTEQALDVTEPMEPGQVRAGPVSDEAALFGGVAAEGRIGDFKIYNDRVQFIVQGVREGSYTTWQGGAVIDADTIRPAGQPGRDLIDDWVFMAGNGHILDPERVWVTDDGAESGRAVIRAKGPESPLDYVVGFFENPDIIADEGLYFITDFALEADSDLLEVTTTVLATEKEVTLQLGDVLLGSKELSRIWVPGTGLTGEADSSYPWVALVGKRNDASLALMAEPDREVSPLLALGFLGTLLTTISGFDDAITIAEGESVSITRYYGVAPDLATLTDAWLALGAGSTGTVEGTVEADDGPVPGARVSLVVNEAPWTMAITDEKGHFEAHVPAGASVDLVADGRGTGLFTDLPEGAAPYSAYTTEQAQDSALDSMSSGADPIPLARGRGWTSGDTPLHLEVPATLVLNSDDGLPFEARISYASSYDGGDGSVVQGSPSGYAALAWARDGEVTVLLEPGEYGLMVWRGVRWETWQGSATLEANEETRVDFVLEEAYHLDDWLVADPHTHASSSPDGSIIMAERLVVEAGQGIQAHFGTDHDHVVDYGPLLEPLGLEDLLATVISCEMSPIMRGHLNLYPLEPIVDQPNNGAWLWWRDLVDSTTEELGAISEQLGDPLIQVNHPMDGLASLAGWSPGLVMRDDYWCDDFHAIEVLNGGNHDEAVDFWLDLAARGLVTAPVGVSDNHSFIGSSGLSLTFLDVGTDNPADLEPRDVRDAILGWHTIASLGPFLDMSIPPGSTVTEPTTLEVAVLAPSWIQVDTLYLLRDGEVEQTVEGNEASFVLEPDQDALYAVEAVGSQTMSPVSGHTPWALSGPILFDAGADGWYAPLEPLEILD